MWVIPIHGRNQKDYSACFGLNKDGFVVFQILVRRCVELNAVS